MSEYLHTFKPFIYIHIPKSAGTSVQRSGLIDIKDWHDHKTAREINNLSNYYSFTFIRNPYDKVYSSYNYYLNGRHRDNNKKNWIKTNYPTFKEFILDYNNSKKVCKYHFETTQKQYITNDNGEIIVDYVGNFYNVSNEFKKIQDLNPIYISNYSLPVENKPIVKPIIKITDEMAEIIYNNWKEDFDFFNFNKNSYK